MKQLLLIWFACVALAFTALSAPVPTFRHLPGYMKHNHCAPFSWSAMRMLQKQGVPVHIITYGWSQFGGKRGLHAAIIFQWEGKYYFMDNARMGARRVSAKTDLGVVNHISGEFGNHLWMVGANGVRIPPKKLADMFAPPPAWMDALTREGK